MLDFTMTTPVFPEHLACRNGDARCNASRFLRSLSTDNKDQSLFAYGNEAEVIVCRGTQVKQKTTDGSSPTHVWHQVHDVFEQHKHHFIFGFLGYGLGLVASSDSGTQFPPYWFGAATLAIRFNAEQWQVLHGDDAALAKFARHAPPCGCEQKTLALVATLDRSADADYLRQVEQAMTWVQQEASRRMTIARRVPLPPVDLLDTFHCQPSHNSLSRSFYLDIGNASFVGKCPEVLLDWTPQNFRSHKLSGTYPKARDPESDRQLAEQFISDEKITSEHRLSAEGFAAGIAKVGSVSREEPAVLDLDRLRHMMTTFNVRVNPGTSIADCLRAVLPAGVSPCAEGLPTLLALEKDQRGPYYGLVGLYSPDGRASFTQILRSVFRQNDNYYSWVGAAVTNGSTAEGELEESKLKLSDIMVALE